MDDIFIFGLVIAFVGLIGAAMWWDHRRKEKRRNSLRRDTDSGMYIWTDFDGSERRAREDPSRPDGLWDQESSSGDDGGGDGGGGD